MRLLRMAVLAATTAFWQVEAHATLSHILPLLTMMHGGGGNPFMPKTGGNPFMPGMDKLTSLGGGGLPFPIPGLDKLTANGGGGLPFPIPGLDKLTANGAGALPFPIPGLDKLTANGAGALPSPTPDLNKETVQDASALPPPTPDLNKETVQDASALPPPTPDLNKETVQDGGKIPEDDKDEDSKKSPNEDHDHGEDVQNHGAPENIFPEIARDLIKEKVKFDTEMIKQVNDAKNKELQDIFSNNNSTPKGADRWQDIQKQMQDRAQAEWQKILDRKKKEWSENKDAPKGEAFDKTWEEQIKKLKNGEQYDLSAPLPGSKASGKHCKCLPRHPKRPEPTKESKEGTPGGLEYQWEAERTSNWVIMPDGRKVITSETGWQPTDFRMRETNGPVKEEHWGNPEAAPVDLQKKLNDAARATPAPALPETPK